jgi:5-hydroxyisourate hydrolase
MSGITSHVLDTSRGRPAEGINVHLEMNRGDAASPKWALIGTGTTNADGRVPGLSSDTIEPGHYRITFQVADYFSALGADSFYPVVRIEFEIKDADQHYHVPLLLNPFGYSTYRGS